MKFITVATHSTPAFEIFRASAEHHGISLEVLGWGKEYTSHNCKSLWLIEYLETLPEDEIVLYSDGYDAFFVAPESEILMKFKQFDHPFVASAEQNLNVEANFFTKLSTYLKLKKGTKPYQFLNAGQWIGRAGAAKEILNLTISPDHFDQSKQNDQSTLNQYFAQNPNALKLDDTHQIFSCTAGRTGLTKQDYTVKDDRVINNITGTKPAIMHFAGKNFDGANYLLSDISYLRDFRYEVPDIRLAWYTFKNKLIDQTCQDNYLFHLILHSLLIIFGIFALAYALSFLF